MPNVAIRITQTVTVDRRPSFEPYLQRMMLLGVREAAREYHRLLDDRIVRQDIPGPPLSPQTIAIKKRRGAILPDHKWLFEDIAVSQAQVVTEAGRRWAAAYLVAPAERPFYIYRLLERGGVNETGNIVPPRPLFETTALADSAQIIAAFRRGAQSAGET